MLIEKKGLRPKFNENNPTITWKSDNNDVICLYY